MLVSPRRCSSATLAHRDDEIRTAISGNPCRCTGYDGIVKAIASVAAPRRLVVDALSHGSGPNASTVIVQPQRAGNHRVGAGSQGARIMRP